jgi:hypothetical protein
MSLVTRTPSALEIGRRDLTNRVCSGGVWAVGPLLRGFLNKPMESVVATSVAWRFEPAAVSPRPRFESTVASTLKMKGLGGL